MRVWLRPVSLALGLALAGAAPAIAQESVRPGVVQSAILTVEFDRLFAESAYGQRVSEMLDEQGASIAAENRRIEADLTAEERDLTEKRSTLDPVEFRKLAEAFDEKVQALRREQDAKARALGNLSEEHRRQFLAQAEPILGGLMREAGAAVILDKRSVFLSADVIDITETAISRIDDQIGDGGDNFRDDIGEVPASEPDPSGDGAVPAPIVVPPKE